MEISLGTESSSVSWVYSREAICPLAVVNLEYTLISYKKYWRHEFIALVFDIDSGLARERYIRWMLQMINSLVVLCLRTSSQPVRKLFRSELMGILSGPTVSFSMKQEESDDRKSVATHSTIPVIACLIRKRLLVLPWFGLLQHIFLHCIFAFRALHKSSLENPAMLSPRRSKSANHVLRSLPRSSSLEEKRKTLMTH